MDGYIERKKAIELIQPHVKPQTVYGEEYLQAIEHVTDILTLMPAADVQPVKHGKWIAENQDKKRSIYSVNRGYADRFTCSNCNNYTYTYTLMKVCEYDYCPNCGARMDGDAE